MPNMATAEQNQTILSNILQQQIQPTAVINKNMGSLKGKSTVLGRCLCFGPFYQSGQMQVINHISQGSIITA